MFALFLIVYEKLKTRKASIDAVISRNAICLINGYKQGQGILLHRGVDLEHFATDN